MHSEPLPLGELAPDAVAPEGGEGTSTGGIASQVVRVFAENRLAIVGALIIIGMVLFCFVGPLFYSTNQTSTQNALLFSTQNSPPSRAHLLGTDQSGFDVLGRIMYGGQVSL
jgi:peptide/nickel transport system permease protein